MSIVNGKGSGIITVFDFSGKEVKFDSLIYVPNFPIIGIDSIYIASYSPSAYFGKNGKMYFINGINNLADSNFKFIPKSNYSPNPNLTNWYCKSLVFENGASKIGYLFYSFASYGDFSTHTYDSLFYMKFKLNNKNTPEIIEAKKFLGLRKNLGDINGFIFNNINTSIKGSTAWFTYMPDTNTISAFKVTPDSVFKLPVKSKLLWNPTLRKNAAPQIHFNNKGDKLYSVDIESSQNSQFKIAEYPFDQNTGKLGSPRFMFPHFTVERDDSTFLTNFTVSPNDSILYISTNFDLTVNRPSHIKRTRIISCNVFTKTVSILKTFNTKSYVTNIATAPNGKIYYCVDSNYWEYSETKQKFLFYEMSNVNKYSKKITEKMVHRTSANFFYGSYSNYSGYVPLNVNAVGQFKGQCSDSFKFDVRIDSGYFKSAKLYFGDGDSANINWPFLSPVFHKYKLSKKYGYELQCTPKYDGLVKYFLDSVEVANVARIKNRKTALTSGCTHSKLVLSDSFINTQVIQYFWGNGADSTFYAFNQPKFIQQNKLFNKTTYPSQFILNTRIANAYCDYTIKDTLKLAYLTSPSHTLYLASDTLCSGSIVLLKDSSSLLRDLWFKGFNQNDSIKNSNYLNYNFYTSPQSADSVYRIYTQIKNNFGCSRFDTFPVLLKASPKLALSSTDTTVCAAAQPFEAQLHRKVFPAGANFWLGDANQSTTTDTFWNKKYTSPGTYSLVAKANTLSGCRDSVKLNFRVLANPKANFTISDSVICAAKQKVNLNDQSTAGSTKINYWRYNLGNNIYLLGKDKTDLNFSTAGKYNISYLVKDEENCVDSIIKSITVNPAPQTNWNIMPANLQACLQGNLFTISEMSAGKNKVLWNNTTDTTQSFSSSFTSPGNKSVMLIKTLGTCSDTLVKTLKIFANPRVSFTDSIACKDQIKLIVPQINLGSAPISTYLWSATGLPNQNTLSASFNFNSVGPKTVTIQVSDTHQCTANFSRTLKVSDTPQFRIVAEPQTLFQGPLYGYTLYTQPANFSNYFWWLGNTGTSTLSQPQAKFMDENQNQLVQVKVTSAAGCSSVKDTLFYPLGLTGYYFPNSFTPNGDGINDGFGIAGPQYIKSIKLRIYNKWGGKVFETQNPYEQWTGQGAIPGLYIYTAEVRDVYNRYKEIKGVVLRN